MNALQLIKLSLVLFLLAASCDDGTNDGPGDGNRAPGNANQSDTDIDTYKIVCCWCECVIEMPDSVEKEVKMASGKGIICKSACTQRCQEEARWQLNSYAHVDCSQLPDPDAG